MSRYTLEEFVNQTAEKPESKEKFNLETSRILEVNLDGKVWAKSGSMIAYNGQIKFTREGLLEHGFGKLLKKTFTGEGAKLMKAEGNGCLYLAEESKSVSILNLYDDHIFVNGNDILAFEDTIEWDINIMKKITGVFAGGLFNISLKGSGAVAITSHHTPLTLRVRPDEPVLTDLNATVAWSGSLTPDFKTDISFKTFIGRGSGESIQMLFRGEGFVVVQPQEERYFQRDGK